MGKSESTPSAARRDSRLVVLIASAGAVLSLIVLPTVTDAAASDVAVVRPPFSLASTSLFDRRRGGGATPAPTTLSAQQREQKQRLPTRRPNRYGATTSPLAFIQAPPPPIARRAAPAAVAFGNAFANAVGASSPPSKFYATASLLSKSKSTAASSLFAGGEGDDGEDLQALFAEHCDAEGLMTEKALQTVPAIAELLEEGDLPSGELRDMWSAAPKFSQVDGDAAAEERINVDSFVQVYRDIDDLFEDEDGEEEGNEEGDAAPQSSGNVDASADATTTKDSQNDDDEDLEVAFASLSSAEGLVSFDVLQGWTEVESLLADGMLGKDELQGLWDRASKEGEDGIDIGGFLTFNAGLDDLFVFDDEEDEVEEKDDVGTAPVASTGIDDDGAAAVAAAAEAVAAQVAASNEERKARTIVSGDDLPPGVLFAELAGGDLLVGKIELERWGDLQEMLESGDLLPDELSDIFKGVTKAQGTADRMDEEGFEAFFDEINALFEDDDDDDDAGARVEEASERALKEELYELLEDIVGSADAPPGEEFGEVDRKMACGLESTETEQERILEVASELEREPYNMIVMSGGTASKENLVGTWELVYSSSSTMKYNEGLSGLAGGLTRFGGLEQKLMATKYMSDVDYTERVVGKLGAKPFDVKIDGDWDIRTETSMFTGKPSCVLSVVPNRVSYGPRDDKADHWKSLGPMNLLQLSYLDEDFRIMRGLTSTDTLFILRRK